MSGLRAAVADYLAIRRGLGFALAGSGQLLKQFVEFAEAAGASVITTELALQWATLPQGASPAWQAQRLSVVRCFARWQQAFDPATQVPGTDLLPARGQRAAPYLYSIADVTALMRAAARLRSPLAAATMTTFVGLVFATGMRRGEALALDRQDLDLDTGVLTIRDAKFHKQRTLPLHRSTVDAVAWYLAQRERLCSRSRTPALFVSPAGARLAASTVSQTFRGLLHDTGVGHGWAGRRPRIHDARHTFAVNTLRDWYRDGGDVQARLPLLSAYLGHADPRHTYWYLSAAPELLALAADRLQRSSDTVS